ncbi:MAG: hypothetical protein SNJ62_04885 [Chloracidobacterium sp.]
MTPIATPELAGRYGSDDYLPRVKRLFQEARDGNEEARREALIDRDYFDGYQLTAEERRVLQARKQPDVVFNRIRPAILGIAGVWKMGQNDPRAYPRNPQDQDASDVASKVLRYCADQTGWHDKRVDCALDYLIEGITAVEVAVDDDGRIEVQPVGFEEFFYDPRSRQPDFADARFLGVAKWMFADDVTARWPQAADSIGAAFESFGIADTFNDRPDDLTGWTDAKRRRVFVVEMYHKEGTEWMRCVFWGAGILDRGLSAYVDERGRTVCPIVARSCFIDRDNRRYGTVRDLRGPQDEINKRRSKLLHLVSMRQVRAVDSVAVETAADIVRSEAARPDGVLPPGWDVVSVADMTSGQASLLSEAKSEIERMGPSPAVLAQQSASASGRAQMIRQRAGMTEHAVIFAGLERFELSVYRAMWSRVRQFWRAPMYIRVTDDNSAPQFVGINQPVMGPQQIMAGPDGMPMVGRPVLGYQNSVAEMDVDLVLDATPDTATLAAEEFEALVQLAQAGVAIPPELLIEASTLPNKGKLVERMRAMAEAPNPQAEIAARQAEASVSRLEAEAALTAARAQSASFGAMLDGMAAGAAAG